MKKKYVLFLILLFNVNIFASNTIVAIVNNTPILLSSIQNELLNATSNEEKIQIINNQINLRLQIKKVDEFNLQPTSDEINLVLIDFAEKNNLSVDHIFDFEEIDLIKKEISEKLSILNLQRFITKDLEKPLDIKSKCSNYDLDYDQKQIKIAQIIISEIDSELKNPDQKITLIRSFLNKLSKHISKGASFEVFAKLHSQHPSYKDGGVTEWLTINNPTLEMLDLLKSNEVSEIYSTAFGLAIAIKIDERFVSSKLIECEEQLIYQNAEKYFASWLQNLRDEAYIEIYYDKL